jgi:hypothetical protein
MSSLRTPLFFGLVALLEVSNVPLLYHDFIVVDLRTELFLDPRREHQNEQKMN